MNTQVATDTVAIALSTARPLRVKKGCWPLVTKAKEDTDHNNQELFRRYYLYVRQHARAIPGDADTCLAPHPDNRVVVYGYYSSSWQGESGITAGYVCTLDEAADMLRTVGEEIGADESLIRRAIADLPEIDPDAAGDTEGALAGFTDAEIAAEFTRRNLTA